MESLTKYSVGDWIYRVVASLIAAVIFAAVVFILRWIWHWIRNFSAEYRRSDQTARIIKIFVYRRYIQRANVCSLSRGQFFVISRCLQMFIVGVIFVAMGSFISWITDIHIAFYLFVGFAVWMFVEATSWLDARWTQRSLDNVDEKALADAAAILGEAPDEVPKSRCPAKGLTMRCSQPLAHSFPLAG
jgi:hypothetical protein